MDTPVTGTVFGKLTFIGLTGVGHKARRWKLKCHCGREVDFKPSEVARGKRITCGCRLKQVVGSEMVMSRFLKRLIAHYKKSSRVRGLEWDLCDEYAVSLFESACHYCGAPPSRIIVSSRGEPSPRGVNGIDRLNNNEGYIKENVVSCCSRCNHAKHDLSYEQYIEMIRNTYKNLNL